MTGPVLVTGAASPLGARVAATLASARPAADVVAVDHRDPVESLGGARFAAADIRRPEIADVLARHRIRTVVLLRPRPADPADPRQRAEARELASVGAMQVLAACQQSERIRALVVESSTDVYGSSARDPAVFAEEWTARRAAVAAASGATREARELEAHVRGFRRRRPDVRVALPRLADVLGAAVRTDLGDHLRRPVVPRPAGYDARLQFLHEDDAVAAICRAAVSAAEGEFNVAGDGVLLLSQAIRRAGGVSLPLPPGSGRLAGLLGATGVCLPAGREDLLTHGRVVDTTRMRSEFGFVPEYSSAETFRCFLDSRPRPAGPAGPAGPDPGAATTADDADSSADPGADPTGAGDGTGPATEFLRSRLAGDYAVDEFGFDPQLSDGVLMALLRPLYRTWFRVEAGGLRHVPDTGPALVVGNHSGTLPVDSLMTQFAIHDEHPAHRHLRMLGADLVYGLPFVGELARKSGGTRACAQDAERLLASGELVGVWPEGFKGIGKPYSQRYVLQRFGRGGFVSTAVRAGAPIVPCAIVGAEEIYPLLGTMPGLASRLGLPYVPVTPTFPWLGPLGLVPLPSKWLIEFGPPIPVDEYGPDSADDPAVVTRVTRLVRDTIQDMLRELLKRRERQGGAFG